MVAKQTFMENKGEAQKVGEIIQHYEKQGISLKRDQIHSLKFIHKKIVFISGIDSRIMERDDLETEKYFGQYGKVMNISSKKETNNLHIVYENKKQASFAIIALSGYRYAKLGRKGEKNQFSS